MTSKNSEDYGLEKISWNILVGLMTQECIILGKSGQIPNNLSDILLC